MAHRRHKGALARQQGDGSLSLAVTVDELVSVRWCWSRGWRGVPARWSQMLSVGRRRGGVVATLGGEARPQGHGSVEEGGAARGGGLELGVRLGWWWSDRQRGRHGASGVWQHRGMVVMTRADTVVDGGLMVVGAERTGVAARHGDDGEVARLGPPASGGYCAGSTVRRSLARRPRPSAVRRSPKAVRSWHQGGSA